MKEYKFKTPRNSKRVMPSKIARRAETETLTGYIDGVKASNLEERFATAVSRYATFRFKMPIGMPGEPGWKELDFLLLSRGTLTAVEIDDTTFIHRGENSGQDPDDLARIAGLQELGVNVDKIIHIDNTKVSTKESADATARSLFA